MDMAATEDDQVASQGAWYRQLCYRSTLPTLHPPSSQARNHVDVTAKTTATTVTEGVMGFYLRTSLRAGPFRLNLSPSGIGVSAGVPGFRVGTGPRGNYVRVGGAGVFYSGSPARTPAAPQRAPHAIPAEDPNEGILLHELNGASVQQLVAANPSDVISQIERAAHRTPLWPFAAALIGVLAFSVLALVAAPYGLLLILIGLPVVLWLRQRDIARRSVVVFYQVDDDPAVRFDHLATSNGFASRVQRVWHVEAQGDLSNPYQQKVNAGASALIRRSAASLSLIGPPVLVTNIAVPSLNGKNRSVYFLPDRVLVRHGRDYAEVPYAALHATANPQRFIEEDSPPGDSQVVGSTWRYANAKGGPDRRFKNNCQLPIMLYGRLTLSSPQGLLMVWDFSRPDVAASLADALNRMT